MQRRTLFVLASFAVLLCAPVRAHAVLPPDVLFTVGSQVVQFFSLIAVVVGGVLGSVALYFRTHLFSWHAPRLRKVLVGALMFVLVVSIGVLLFENARLLHLYEDIRDRIGNIGGSEPTISEDIPSLPAYQESSTTSRPWESGNAAPVRYFGDTLVFYGVLNDEPLYLEVDLNRKQIPSGLYLHYYFGVGYIGGESYGVSDVLYSSSTEPGTGKLLKDFQRYTYSDLSTRRSYTGTAHLGDEEIVFSMRNLIGDFITRDTPAYTRIGSVGDGILTLDGFDVPVFGFSETLYSDDYTESIFFPGVEELSTKTYQFILFDDDGNFYLIDQSEVSPISPAYASHTWVLYKEKKTGYTKKAFEAFITEERSGDTPKTWSVNVSELGEARMSLRAVKALSLADQPHRQRILVEGTITDEKGTRNIQGFLHRLRTP